MSRTDKDTPWWTRAREWVPVHWQCQSGGGDGRFWYLRGDRICDLPAEPSVSHYLANRRRRFQRKTCFWEPVTDQRPYAMPPKWFVDHVWNNAQRREVRNDCLEAIKEYRATRRVETTPSTRQHRHGATWLYW